MQAFTNSNSLVSGLTNQGLYTVWLVAKDSLGNTQTALSSVNVKTVRTTPPSFEGLVVQYNPPTSVYIEVTLVFHYDDWFWWTMLGVCVHKLPCTACNLGLVFILCLNQYGLAATPVGSCPQLHEDSCLLFTFKQSAPHASGSIRLDLFWCVSMCWQQQSITESLFS